MRLHYLCSRGKISVLFLWISFLISPILVAQNYTISGTVRDKETKETLVGVPVVVNNLESKGVSTEQNGQYKLTLPKGKYTISIKYIGFEEENFEISLTNNITRNIELKQSSIGLKEVVVAAQQPDANVTAPQTGVQKLEISEINKLPVLLGERDIIKTIQLMPGVQGAGEGSSGFYVRGGSADQNLILLDDVSLYNASHLMGFFSTFNSEVLRDVTLYKGALPAQYGERLSSILDVQQRIGDNQKYHVNGGIGLISSNINAEGPIQKGKSSFLIGARRTYADAIARLSGVEDAQNAYLYFYDLNMKLNFALSDKDMVSVSGYLGRDKMVLKEAAEINWGNSFLTANWSHTYNRKWMSKTSLAYNQYDYYYAMDLGMDLSGESKIKDYSLKHEFIYEHNPNSKWRFGLSSTYHDMAPGDFKLNASDQDNSVNLHHRYSSENSIYASNQIKVNDKLEIVYGLRMSAFMALGKGEYYTMDANHNVTDSVWYKSGEVVKTYINLEPRISAAYKLNSFSSIKAAYARTVQNMHLLSYAAQGTPIDRWTSSSNNIKPELADQVSLGYFRNFSNNMFEFSIEGYYKDMQNQLDYKDGANIEGYDVVETELLSGKGRSYGVELMLKKRTGRFTGWISYTLSKSEKKIDGINDDRWYNAFQDRTHDISLVGMYELSPKWSLSAAWVYYTGNAISYPSGKYQINGKDVMYYAERNGYRMPAYHRLDLGATCLLKKTSKFHSELVFGLYNAYGRENAYMIEFRTNTKDPDKTSAYQYALFKFVPSISWNFKF
ncbi:TonB-dependent receptor [Dysgonomonas macrotermitis]|uniref:Outer membrane receptor proteins, mostly Fe transport n=1 Tax=Dysgonomonas macrotermitis TaxID=1346286 RepID=A0A1M4SM60_9BACT|nr:TonB-dependent receptor [Dysgonomonas macrotermitis]SHE33354.1 Outer membrane receptor proteins, mostly Fe transport [Dysgonomonas macrotermitis]